MSALVTLALLFAPLPAQPALGPEAPLLPRAYALCVDGERILAAGSGGLAVFERKSGELVSGQALPGGGVELLCREGRAYVASGPAGISVFSLEGPEAPRLLARWASPGGVAQIADAGGSRLLVADGAFGVRLLEAEESGALRELATLDVGNHVRGVALLPPGGDGPRRALAAAGNAGVFVLELGDEAIELVTRIPTAEAREVAVFPHGQRAVVADGPGGILLLELRGETPAVGLRIAPLGADRVRGVGIHGEYVAVAEGTSGGRILREAGTALVQVAAYPELPGAVSDALVVEEEGSLSALFAMDRLGVHRVKIETPRARATEDRP